MKRPRKWRISGVFRLLLGLINVSRTEALCARPSSRSYNMSRIRSKDTNPEEKVRKYLFAHGFRYRKNVKNLPGSPDVVLPKYKTVIFVQGCFWHMHDCGRFQWPATNQDYWEPKIRRNVERDQLNREQLLALGWKVLTVWECELKKKNIDETMSRILQEIRNE